MQQLSQVFDMMRRSSWTFQKYRNQPMTKMQEHVVGLFTM